MAKKYLTLQFPCGSDYINADWLWDLVLAYYIEKFTGKSFAHVTLSVGPFTAFILKNGNALFGGSLSPCEDLDDLKDFIEAGAGVLYQEKITPWIGNYPEPQEETPVKIANNPIDPYPELNTNNPAISFEDFIQAVCRRLTEPYHAMTGAPIAPGVNEYFGIDALHEYILKVGDPPVQHRAIIPSLPMADWWGARLCGVERGEFSGPAPFAPNNLPSGTEDDPDPSHIWVEDYQATFKETPFYWICGLLSFIPIRPLYKDPPVELTDDEHAFNMDDIPIDENETVWCELTPVERTQFIMDYLLSDPDMADIVLGAYIMSGDCHFTKFPWYLALPKYNAVSTFYRYFNIPQTGEVPRPPLDIDEAHLRADRQGEDPGDMGKWKELFEDWLDFMTNPARGNFFNHEDCVWFSDREAKDLVVQQYDGTVTVDDDRLKAIIDVLTDIDLGTTKWQRGLNEWDEEDPIVPVNRPPDYVEIQIGGVKEYYSLSECWWHLLSALNDIASGAAIDEKILEAVIGPCEPENLDPNLEHPRAGQNNVFRVLEWWQHDSEPIPTITANEIIAQAPALFLQANTAKLGPTFRVDRQVKLRKVKAFNNVSDKFGNNIDVNCAEMLYLMAKTLKNYFFPQTEPEEFDLFPSHVLPKSYYTFLQNGRYELIFSNQLKWFDLGQRWTMKPAILNE